MSNYANMSKYRSVPCPKHEHHKEQKILLFVGNNEVYANCGLHKWIKIIFKRGNEVINFENVAVVLESMGEGFHFEHTPIPVLALGPFELKKKLKEKWQT